VVSIWSLRKWYDGPVTVFTTRPQSHEIGAHIASDRRLRVKHRTAREVSDSHDHIGSYLTKLFVLEASPYEATMYLDADTLVAGPLTEFVESAQCAPITVTMFCNWSTNGPRANPCLEAWRRLRSKRADEFNIRKLLDHVLSHPMPFINAGVLAIRRGAAILGPWQRLSLLGRTTPTPDETALQLLVPHFSHQLLGSHFNCYPILPTDSPDVRIWHFAGVTHLRHPRARAIWLPAYRECKRLNVARIARWSRIEKRVRQA
jgi:hypothetical protein